ncbi:filamentous hemagglutinin family protein [Janthinobacterium sp. SUN073]|uniref:filamentous haemagglutinin family protein n=1 Tax=Janthinobacterium sp. SUN073 TaxID=3004102 RepID=UPI0025B15305|nr:filamentous haemagglutinin family protein [Janthinobacterium sp. SUN073]MDN2700292.1 filamentous hemagglutinin family protein [Janthinobacterium sp. SUN073]
MQRSKSVTKHASSSAMAGNRSERPVRLKPLALAIALLLQAGGAQAQQPFSGAWFAGKGAQQGTAAATGRLPNGQAIIGMDNKQAQQQKAHAQLQSSLNNLHLAARAIAVQQAAQQAARQAAIAAGSQVPDGLAEGGLKVDSNSLTAGWFNANGPTQAQADGKTVVTVKQTADKAILNWETFNIGQNTTLQFDQLGNWSVLNRVNDPLARPSQVLGQIKADGTVMLVNRNGIVFTGSSQVDTRSLVAAAVGMSDSQFKKGIYSETLGSGFKPTLVNDLVLNGTVAKHADATADVVVQAGAQISTRKPQTVTEGGGYVLLAGREVHNGGSLSAPNGQVMLAAGDSFVIRKGLGTDANQTSSTRGNEVDVKFNAHSVAGKVTNAGLVQALTGDVTLTGRDVRQAGVLLSSTSVTTRGTVHLKADGSEGLVTLAPDSLTTVLLDDSGTTALDVQRDALIKDSAVLSDGAYNRRDLSLIQIASGRDIVFDTGSLTLATGGQVNALATRRTQVARGASIDVSGAVGVNVAMASNNVLINVQGNEQRDAPGNRDSKVLNNTDLWVDRRDLVRVAAGTNGYPTDRWYTGGGLLEVSGYLNTGGHGIGEWAAQGGTVAFKGAELVTQAGSSLNVSGGTFDVQTGMIRQSWLSGKDGQLYKLSTAPGDMLYSGLYRGFESQHKRWGDGATENFATPLIGARERLENGYIVGRDAGHVIVGTGSAVLEGGIESSVFQGERQKAARDATLDSYRQSQLAGPRHGQLLLGQIVPVFDAASTQLRDNPTALLQSLHVGMAGTGGVPAPGLLDAMPESLVGKAFLDAGWLNAQQLGGFKAYAKGGIVIDAAVQVAPGGEIALHAPDIAVNAGLSARGGSIALGDIVNKLASGGNGWIDTIIAPAPKGQTAGIKVASGVTLDTRGLWSQLQLDPADISGLPYVNGGTVSLVGSGAVTLAAGSVIDTSSGAATLANGKLQGGRGGNITLKSNQNDTDGKGSAALVMDGELRGYGVKGGGTLSIDSGIGVAIGGGVLAENGILPAGQAMPVHLTLAKAFTIKAGTVLDSDFSYISEHLAPGQVLLDLPDFSVSRPYTLAAAWVVPPASVSWEYIYIGATNGYTYMSGMTVPAGVTLNSVSGKLGSGYLVPAEAFPNGMPVAAYNATVAAGTAFAADVTLNAGERLLAGNRVPQDLAIKPLLVLDSSLFQRGFAHYDITGQQGVQVAQGAVIDVAMPVLRADPAAARTLASGADSAAALQPWLAPLWQEDAVKGVLTQRAGADIALAAGTRNAKAPLVIGKDAALRVDEGQSISLTGNGQVTVEGKLSAAGGRISVLPGTFVTSNEINRPDGSANAQSIWIGNGAVLDVAGRAVTATDAQGGVYGHVGSGGSIEIGARHKPDAAQVEAADAFVVLRPGARLEASGAAAQLDLPGQGSVLVASDGGSIALSSFRGLFLDGSLHAAAGGAGAAGGTLALNLETPNYGIVGKIDLKGSGVEDAVRVPRELLVSRLQGDSGLASDLVAGDRDPALRYGAARLGVDRIQAGGFDHLALLANGLLSFDGDVDLSLGQSLRLTATSLALGEKAGATSQVRLAAPYIRLAGTTRTQADDHLLPNPVNGSGNGGAGGGKLGMSAVADAARLTLDASLIDLANTVSFGANGSIVQNVAKDLEVKRDAFGELELRSSGDIRMRGDAALYTPGNLTLAGAQIYPVSGAKGSVIVGQQTVLNEYGQMVRQFDPARSLTIERTGDASAPLPAMPYSVFGSLELGAATVNQGGVLRAPLGKIMVGMNGSGTMTSQLNLLPGSVTSVSANGLVMPYGGTLDGLSYMYDGDDVAYKGVGNDPAIVLAGKSVDVRNGAVLDMTGGGSLTGAAFLAGRGGSTDARLNPLVQTSAKGGFVLPRLATNPVYAIVPGPQAGYAPVVAENGAGDPALGRQITIGAGVPGLAAGTYTLLPSSFALLPGAFRVELNGLAAGGLPMGSATAMRNGSYAAAVQLGISNTSQRDALSSQALLTSADVLRSYSQFNETSYADFALAQAVRDGVPRPLLERDAKALHFDLVSPVFSGSVAVTDALRFAGKAQYTPGKDGFGGSALLLGGYLRNYEILGSGAAPTAGFEGTSVSVDALNAIAAPRLGIGGLPVANYNDPFTGRQQANVAQFLSGAGTVVLRDGAVLRAGEVFLVTNTKAGGIIIEQGGGINTLGRGAAAWDSSNGFVYAPGASSVLAVSNGRLDMLAPTFSQDPRNGPGRIDIGACAPGATCSGATPLYSEGTIAAATDQSFNLRDAATYGTRNLVLAVGGINVGSEASLAAMAARDALPAGLTLNQGILDRLLRGDASAGAPALNNLVMTARDAINFYDNVELSTINASTGKSSLERLVIGTPAIYGAGGSDAVARIKTDVLVWNGATTAPGLPAAEGAGSGKGHLQIDARQVEFGYGPNSRPDTIHSLDRLILGFGDVVINAAERITANHSGSLSVYQSQSGWDTASKGYLRSGGNLSLNTALLTGNAGSINKIKAGGDILVARPSTAKDAPQDAATLAGALGAEIALDGRSVTLDTAVLLPSGKLTVSAERDVLLGDAARLDLAGRKIAFHDVSKYSWGGDVVLDSRGGDVRQAAGSRIDISAVSNRAGKLTATALGQEAGTVSLLGGIAGGSSGHYDAGGTDLPFAAGGADIRGQHIADFGGLNQRLTDGGLVGSRSFQLKQGDLVLGNELRAREINVSVDAGHLTVKGTIDASGEQVGSIRLAARDGVHLAGSAVLDAHGSVLRVDSYGQVIEAPNRAVIDIDAGSGRLVLDGGARMDLRAGTAGKADRIASLGTLELSAQRLGGARGNDVAIDAAGPLAIDGARAITVNGFWSYKDARAGTETTVDGRPYQIIDQDYLDRKHDDSVAFMTGALANGGLMNGRLSGLRNYRDAFHLRPGVAILSATPDGDLHVDGDIDLSGYRYASVNPHTGQTAVHGSGEAGALVLRAGGKLNIFGSINDGFDGKALPVTPDDNGWMLARGRVPFGADVIVPRDQLVTLADDTFFQSGRTLNYDLPMKAMGMRADTALPAQATLTADLQLPAGTVLGGAVRNAAGAVVYAAGTVLASNVTLSSGMQLDAGSRLPVPMQVAAMTWPGGVPLPYPIGAVNDTPANGVVLAGALTLRKGALVPSETWVRLPGGADSVALRPADADGNQGRNWALAPMLASGSQSWSMRLVGGADTQAADTRALRPGAPDAGLLLTDHHYSAVMGFSLPKVAAPPIEGVAGNFYWIGDSALYAYAEPGTLINVDDYGGVEAVLEYNKMNVGDLVTWLPEGASFPIVPLPARQQLFSVLRTGTGDLDLLAGGNFSQSSPYGVYTAGTQAANVAAAYRLPRAADRTGSILGPDGGAFKPYVDGGAQSLYQAWYPEHGGNLLVRAQGDVTGDLVGVSSQRRQDALGYMRPQSDSTAIGNWLWRQGTGSAVAQADAVPTAWWINFGSYVAGGSSSNHLYETLPVMTGFTGIGTLGGGNLVLEAGGAAGMLSPRTDQSGRYVARSQGLNLVVASTGRVAPDGSALTLTGGGDLDIRIGGGLNPVAEVRSFATPTGEVTPQTRYQGSRSDLNSTFVNLRGAMRMAAGSVGGIELRFDKGDNQESRAYQVYTATSSIGGGGPVLVPGDSGVRIDTRGDLVLGGVGDAGRVTQINNGTPFTAQGVAHDGEGYSWFSLWTPSTAIDLFSAGGNLTPSTAWMDDRASSNQASAGGRFVLPSQLRAVAASGSLYYGNSSLGGTDGSSAPLRPAEGLLLAPSPVSPHFTRSTAGQLELLARDSIYAGGYAVTVSGADPTMLPSPFNPGFAGVSGVTDYGDIYTHNVNQNAQAPDLLFVSRNAGASPQRYPLFTMTPPTASGYAVQGQLPARYYAVEGDLVGLRMGSIITRSNGNVERYSTWYEGGGPVALRAGRDIVNSGTALGLVDGAPEGLLGWSSQVAYNNPALPLRPTLTVNGSARGNLLIHSNPDDVSVVSAGRDLRYSTFYVAGPGTLEVTAGRDIYMADKAELKSIGPVAKVTPGDRSSGAGIVVAAGVGEHGPDYAAFAARYLDPAKLSEPGKSLADQPGKAVVVYGGRLGLADWLRTEFGYSGDAAGAPAFLAARQAELDQVRQGGASGAARRDLQREYGLSSQLHLVNWLETRYGAGQRNGLGLRFDAASMDARKFFAALPAEQQRVFLRNVYFAELKAGGREYTAAGGVREGSYLRGREAIATLFPSKDAQGKPVTYAGDLTMFSGATYYLDGSEGGSTKRPRKGINYLTREQYVLQGQSHAPVFDLVDAGIHTDFGGNIDILAPGGRTLVGVDGGFVPGEGSGVLTQGAGEIQIYARDSILLGQSRIFTTFGGNILAWSAGGDINAGRGSKSTVVFTPQRRAYDSIGLVSLSPTTPNTGAGIATLNPIPEVPPGDIDLIAPLGTIDAGEAGIRVSGNVNLAALQVVNAENIQVQGKSTGMPVIAAVNVGALSNASAAASQAVTAAQDVLQRERAATRQALPSLFTVKVLGFGNEQADEGGVGKHKGGEPQASNYQPAGVVQVLGAGPLTAPQLQALTPNERRGLQP